MEMHMNLDSINRTHGQANDDPQVGPDAEWSDECDCLHPQSVRAARRALGDSPPATDMAAIFAILADPTRMRVLIALGDAELCVTDLAAATGVNRTTISHQLRVLRTNRLVRRRRAGKVVYYALNDDHVGSLLTMATEHVAENGIANWERVPA
jgi:ArsR family transcriptional regulator